MALAEWERLDRKGPSESDPPPKIAFREVFAGGKFNPVTLLRMMKRAWIRRGT